MFPGNACWSGLISMSRPRSGTGRSSSPMIPGCAKACRRSITCARQGAKTILMAHFGRPKGKPVEKYSLRPVGVALHDLINHPVAFSHDCIGPDAEKIVSEMKDGDVTLLENVRFHAGRRGERSRICRVTRQTERRPLRKRCFWRGPSRTCLDCRRDEIRPAGGDGFPDGEGTQISPRRTGRIRPNLSWSSSVARRFPTKSA